MGKILADIKMKDLISIIEVWNVITDGDDRNITNDEMLDSIARFDCDSIYGMLCKIVPIMNMDNIEAKWSKKIAIICKIIVWHRNKYTIEDFIKDNISDRISIGTKSDANTLLFKLK